MWPKEPVERVVVVAMGFAIVALLFGLFLLVRPGGDETSRNAPSSGIEETSRDQCDHAYPTVCIPPSPPDLNCGDIPYRMFRVLSPDPHRFDGDMDGIGCER